MKLEIGMYIKTKYGSIGKITKFEEAYDFTAFENGLEKPTKRPIAIVDTHYKYVYLIEDIVKASHNIIDLIEVGDYVNGIYIEGNKGYYLETLEHDHENSSLGHIEYLKIYPREIETVVTKEQFESMSYKL